METLQEIKELTKEEIKLQEKKKNNIKLYKIYRNNIFILNNRKRNFTSTSITI